MIRLGSVVSSLLLSVLLFEELVFLLFYCYTEIFVMIIILEGILNFLLVKKLHTLLNLFTILIFPFTVCVIGIKVVSVWRLEWWVISLVQNVIPGKINKPWMILDILWPVETQSVQRLPLN